MTGQYPPPLDRVLARLDTSGDCWLWTGPTRNGYGYVRLGDRQLWAHRVVLAAATGDAGDGRIARHSCDRRACCNPAYLTWGTVSENNQDTADRHPTRYTRLSVCQRGHAMTDDNIRIVRIRGRASPSRQCRTCQNTRRKRAKERE